MTAEVKSEDVGLKAEEVAAGAADVVVVAEKDAVVEKVEKEEEPKKEESEEVKNAGDVATNSPPAVVQKSPSFKEESNFGSDLKEHEKKALNELKQKVEDAILDNKIYKKDEKGEKKEKSVEEIRDPEKEKPEEVDKEEKCAEKEEEEAKEEKKPIEEDKTAEKAVDVDVEKEVKPAAEEEKGKIEEKAEEIIIVDKDISLWGVPLLPSKGAEGTDVVLLKFLRAREFKVNDAFEMLKNTLQWRKENKIDSILEEELGADLGSVAYMDGVDREGHPICYNIYGVFGNEELYQKTFGNEEKRQQFLRWRFQLMENGIKKLEFKPDGVSSLLQITDLKNSPGPSKKDLRVATKQAVGLLQDNYPEFVARNIFINVPFWYYAFNALLSPFLTQRTKSKFVFARPAKVTETLLKYIPAEQIPVHYGGLKRENDSEFSVEDGPVSELFLKSSSKESIEIPAPEAGTTLAWELTVLGWEVSYKEEFVPTDEGSYTIIVQKEKKMGSNEEPVRNSFKNNEPGKIVINIDNSSFKKKRALYRYKIKSSSS